MLLQQPISKDTNPSTLKVQADGFDEIALAVSIAVASESVVPDTGNGVLLLQFAMSCN